MITVNIVIMAKAVLMLKLLDWFSSVKMTTVLAAITVEAEKHHTVNPGSFLETKTPHLDTSAGVLYLDLSFRLPVPVCHSLPVLLRVVY